MPGMKKEGLKEEEELVVGKLPNEELKMDETTFGCEDWRENRERAEDVEACLLKTVADWAFRSEESRAEADCGLVCFFWD